MHPHTENTLQWIAIVCAIFLVLVALVWLSRWKQRRVWKHAPFTIAAMPDRTSGRITGVARPIDASTVALSPGTGRPCVAYEIRVIEEIVFYGSQTHRRETRSQDILCERGGGPFLVVDPTGTATVDPTKAELLVPELHQVETIEALSAPGLLTERLKLWHDSHPTLKDLPFSKLRFFERAIFVDATVTVTGVGTRTDAGLTLASTHEELLTITDQPPPPTS